MNIKFLYQIQKKSYKLFKTLIKLSLIQKLFLLFLILTFIFIIINNFRANKNYYENFESYDDILNNNNLFEIKHNNDTYDKFYAKYYDVIHLNNKKKNYEIGKIIDLEKKHNNSKILDIGCGTGEHVNLLNSKNYDIIGLDQSEDMIDKALSKFPDCNFKVGNILNNNLFDYNSFTHIYCLDRTIYHIQDKRKFFENCYSLLKDDGYLIINLLNRNKFKPYVNTDNNKLLYDSEKYGKKVDNFILKFNDSKELISKYKKNVDNTDNDDDIYASIIEKFQNYDTNSVRKNEYDLYIPKISNIIKIAKSKGFEFYKKYEMKEVKYTDEYLYIFKK